MVKTKNILSHNETVCKLEAIARSNAWKCLQILASERLTVCQLCSADKLGISQPAVSALLSHLKNSGILTFEKLGKEVYYSVNRDSVKAVADTLASIL
jgi:DNA-binding transcriptional ArsR family regulator